MTDAQKALDQAVDRILKPLGYVKRGATWHREREQVISVLNLQKSQWGEDWYLNLGVYLKALGNEVRPPETRCHVRCRVAPLSGGESLRDADALAVLVGEEAVPWLEALSAERGIASFLASERSVKCIVHREVRERMADFAAPGQHSH